MPSKVYSHVYNEKSWNIGLRDAYINQLIKDRVITVDYVQISKNLTNPSTKGLAKDLVLRRSRGMGLSPYF